MMTDNNEMDFSDCSFLAAVEAGRDETSTPLAGEARGRQRLAAAPQSKFAPLVVPGIVVVGQLLALAYFLLTHF